MDQDRKIGLSAEERQKVRHELATIVTVLRTAITMVEKGEEVRSDLVTMIDVPRERLASLLELLRARP